MLWPHNKFQSNISMNPLQYSKKKKRKGVVAAAACCWSIGIFTRNIDVINHIRAAVVVAVVATLEPQSSIEMQVQTQKLLHPSNRQSARSVRSMIIPTDREIWWYRYNLYSHPAVWPVYGIYIRAQDHWQTAIPPRKPKPKKRRKNTKPDPCFVAFDFKSKRAATERTNHHTFIAPQKPQHIYT